MLRGTTCDVILIYIQDPSRPGLRGPFEVQDRLLVYIGQGDLVWYLCDSEHPDGFDIVLGPPGFVATDEEGESCTEAKLRVRGEGLGTTTAAR